MQKNRDWGKIIAYSQIAGSLLGLVSTTMSLIASTGVDLRFRLIAHATVYTLWVLGFYSSFLILKGRKGGVVTSTIYWASQVPNISISSFAASFYSLLYLFMGVSLTESGIFLDFGLFSGFSWHLGSQVLEEHLSFNIIPFVVFLLWAQLGAYDRDKCFMGTLFFVLKVLLRS